MQQTEKGEVGGREGGKGDLKKRMETEKAGSEKNGKKEEGSKR